MDKKTCWGLETMENELLLKLIKMRFEYSPLYHKNKGFSLAGWTRICNELNIPNATVRTIRKRYGDLLYKYRAIRSRESELTPETWPYFQLFEDFYFTKRVSILDNEYEVDSNEIVEENCLKRDYIRWDQQENVIKLLELRRDYDETYRTKNGFSIHGWEKIAKELNGSVTHCSRKFFLILSSYKAITNNKRPPDNKDFFNDLIKMVTVGETEFKKLNDNINEEEVNRLLPTRKYSHWNLQKVVKLVELRKSLKNYVTFQGFAMEGWTVVAEEINKMIGELEDSAKFTANNCRFKFMSICKAFDSVHSMSKDDFDAYSDALLDYIKSQHEKDPLENCDDSFRSFNIKNEMNEEISDDCGSAEDASYLVDLSKRATKTPRIIRSNDRQYFKWDRTSNQNTYKLLNLVIQFASKFGHKKNKISFQTWKEIAKQFKSKVSPGSCRKKYCLLLKKYRDLKKDQENQKARDTWEFYEIFERMFSGSNNDDFNKMFENEIYEEIENDESDYENENSQGDDWDLVQVGNTEDEDLQLEIDYKTVQSVPLNYINVNDEKTDPDTFCTFCLRKASELDASEELKMIYNERLDSKSQISLIEKINCSIFDGTNEKFDYKISNLICAACLENVEATYTFKKHCQGSWKSLKESVPGEIPSIEDEVAMEVGEENSEPSEEEMVNSKGKSDKNKGDEEKKKLKKKPKKSKIFTCPYCEIRKFKKSQQLKLHLENRFCCSICNLQFCDEISFRSHKNYHENMEKPFACGICSKKFRYNSSLTNHITLEHGSPSDRMKEKTFPCNICGSTFRSKVQVKKHKLSKHKNKTKQISLGEKDFVVEDSVS